MRVLLIYPDIRGDLRVRPAGYFYNGIASLSAVLKAAGHEVRFLHYVTECKREQFESDLLRAPADLVGYSATTNLFGFVQRWSRWCRARLPEVLQICGGVHPTLNCESSLLTSELDAVCVGEGEGPLLELCGELEVGRRELGGIANLAFKDSSGAIRRNRLRPLMTSKELDALPLVDRTLFEPDKICDPNRPIVMASRGCPFNCTYCCNQALRVVVGKRPAVRLRSVACVMEELERIRRQVGGVDGFHFDDDIFGIKLDWLREFSAAYRARIALPFGCNIRPPLAKPEVVRLLAEAGCDEVALGVETGNNELRQNGLGRNMDDQVLLDAFRRFEEAGIAAHSFNMVGLPRERMEHALETVKLNARLKKHWRMDQLRITIFYPYAGTALYEEARQLNLLTERNVAHYADDSVLNLRHMSRGQVRFVAHYFRLLVLVYQRLLRRQGKFGRAGVRLLDTLLRSRLARYCLFPLANAGYPWLVRLARGVKWFEQRPGRRSKTRARVGWAASSEVREANSALVVPHG